MKQESKTENYIQQAEDLLIASLKLSEKQKHNVTRKDGYRVNITKVRNGSSRYNPLTEEQLKLLEKLHNANKSNKQIMKIMQISKSKVQRNLQKIFNYKFIPSEKQIKKHEESVIKLRKQGFSYVQVRKKLGVSSTLIFLVLKKNNMQGQYRKN